ncbi:hypothetical protein DYB28_013771 [Aphanomyces astaci]|uniref:HTH CENPB-type domain-containing protein n=1 Tax=Aphanomyces astaci TaxID=112090 RepID=A0A9X8DS84_APHAT|nr:hypothetical protein DYB28_013771 [Aphanomyces astaci]
MVRFASGREDVSGSRRRGGDDSKVAFENDLYAWICGQRAGNGAVISPPIVQQQALVVAKTYTNMNTFQASRGWYYRFCNRYDMLSLITSSVAMDDNVTSQSPLATLSSSSPTSHR